METQVWDGGSQGEVSPGDTKGLVVFLRLRFHVLHVLQCLWHQPQPNQPHAGAGGDVGLGASRGGHTGVFPSVTSPPSSLSKQRALVLPGLTHRASKTEGNSQ